MLSKEKVVVLYGGKSGEHEISLRSAASVLHHLDTEKFDIIPIAIDKDGQIFLNDYNKILSYHDLLPVKTDHSQLIPSLEAHGKLAIEADVIFPVMHGPLYEDGCLQGILESLSVAYVGCGVLSSAIGMDKDLARKVGCQNDYLYANYTTVTAYQTEACRQDIIQQLVHRDRWPLFIKPCAMGSSVGIHRATDAKSLANAIKDALRYDHTILIEDYIEGQEVEIAVLEDLNFAVPPKASTPGEIKTNHADGFYSYNAKYCQVEQSYLHIPALISPEMTQKIQSAAITIFQRLKCQGLARLDFFVSGQQFYFNEINTLPGFTSISMYPKLWQHDNLAYKDLLSHLVFLAKKHHKIKSNRITDYQ